MPNRSEQGRAIWWDPVAGDDANDGLTPETPLRTPDEVIARCTPSEPVTVTICWDGEKWRYDETL